MTAAEIARALGGTLFAGWWLCPCPVHERRGAMSFSLRDSENGLIAVCHGSCPPQVVFAELRRRGLLAGGRECESNCPATAMRGQVCCCCRMIRRAT
jgi:hypothetical protein